MGSRSNRCLISQQDSWCSHINLSFRIVLRAQLASVALAFNHPVPKCCVASFLFLCVCVCHTSFYSKSRVLQPKTERNIQTAWYKVRSPAIPIGCWQAMAAIAKASVIWSAHRGSSQSLPLRRRHSLSLGRNSPQATCNQKCGGIYMKACTNIIKYPWSVSWATPGYEIPPAKRSIRSIQHPFQKNVYLHFTIRCTAMYWISQTDGWLHSIQRWVAEMSGNGLISWMRNTNQLRALPVSASLSIACLRC